VDKSALLAIDLIKAMWNNLPSIVVDPPSAQLIIHSLHSLNFEVFQGVVGEGAKVRGAELLRAMERRMGECLASES
jgi:hypothetical protein